MFGLDKAPFANLINLLLFQGVWFLTVLGAAGGNGWVGATGLLVFLVTHYLLSGTALADFKLAAIAAATALVVETLIVQTGLLTYKASIPMEGVAPLWLLVLWASFALTINGCVNWLHGRYALAALLGAVGGPLSYFGGLKLGAATTDTSIVVILSVVAVVYAIATPALFFLAARFAAEPATKRPDPVA